MLNAGAERSAASSTGVVIVAAGSGVRFGAQDKIFTPLAGIPLLQYSLDLFANHREVGAIVVVLGRHTLEQGLTLIGQGGYANVSACEGGATRADSVAAGIAMLSPWVDMVAVHDAARPCVTASLFDRVLAAARATGAAIPAIPLSDTIHEVDANGLVSRTPDRAHLAAAQTPQIARRDWLEAAYRMDGPVTDEAGRLWAAGYPVRVVDGDLANMKITVLADIAIVERLLAAERDSTR